MDAFYQISLSEEVFLKHNEGNQLECICPNFEELKKEGRFEDSGVTGITSTEKLDVHEFQEPQNCKQWNSFVNIEVKFNTNMRMYVEDRGKRKKDNYFLVLVRTRAHVTVTRH